MKPRHRSITAIILARHFIVKPIGVSGAPTYVDPSYGATYASEAAFEQQAVYGYIDLGTRYRNSNGVVYYIVAPPISGTPQISITP